MITAKMVLAKTGLMSIACLTSLIGVSLVTETAQAQLTNNCPQIFYREPFTSRVVAPAGCPPTNFQLRTQGGIIQPNDNNSINIPPAQSPVAVPDSSQPLPEQVSAAVAVVSPISNRIEITMTNDTGAMVTYEVVGDTSPRMLMAGDSAVLSNLSLPVTVTAVRPDGGLLDLTALTPASGKLEISLRPEAGLDDTQGVIRIQQDGQVFIN